MKRHVLCVRGDDGVVRELYAGAQLTKVNVMHRRLISEGKDTWVIEDTSPTKPKAPILSTITGRPVKKRTIRK